MSEPSFIHLRLHSEYSISDGIVRIDEAVRCAAADGMPALALTDLANLFGLVKFYRQARGAGIKPIAGCDVWIENEADRDKPYRLLLLVQSRNGYLRLCELLSRAYRENVWRGRAEIKRAWFSEGGADDLIALSGAHHGDIGRALLAGNERRAEALAQAWARLFPQRFYIELQRLRQAHLPLESGVQQALALAAKLRLPVVATHPVQFLKADDFKAHEVRVCVSEGYVLADPRRPKHFTEEQYFMTQAEMGELFADIPSALANSVEIARRCNLTLELGINRLPLFPTPDDVTLNDYLHSQAVAGLERRMRQLFADPEVRAQKMPQYRERLEFEIRTIVQMGFPGYFLIVADFINWAKQNGVPVGPGRGSGAGSLVAFSLGITDLDPLRYDLLFERFLNPERVSMPDFDIDFCQDGRDRVIDYVKARYGADSVSQIATFGTMAAKAVVRDVGRVLDLPYSFCDQLAKLIPFQPGKTITLQMAREMEPQLKEREEKEDEVRELLELAERLEGLTRNVGMHAGGVLIAPGRLTDFCPLYAGSGSDNLVSQFDKDDVEAVGLVKFDFLGLTTLTILDWAVRYVRALHPELADFSLDSIPLDDADAYRIFATGNTTAVFQFESRGMRDLLKRARPDRFDDIVALNALYRPGPMDLIPDFIDRKHGRQSVQYLDPRLEPILGPTYGVMVYQEQVMQIAQVIGGYSLGAADLLRRAMGKKKKEEMAKQRDIFVAGAAKNNVSQSIATQLFDLMEKFAGYGFNKSHAAAYALVAYQTAYLKTHYPSAFMAATLSADMADTDKVQLIYDDARANGLTILPPDVHESDYRFTPVDERTIRYGLGAIKGTGEQAIRSIISAREADGPFRDLFDFCLRVDKRLVNRRVIESLIRGGAFDCIDSSRAHLMALAGIALEGAEQASRAAQQVSLFDGLTVAPQLPQVNVAPWPDKERLQNEKLALGFYLSGHPFTPYAAEFGDVVRMTLDRLQPSDSSVVLAGIIYSVRIQMTRRGRMAVVMLDDGRARVEMTVFNELFEQHRHWLKEDRVLVAEGRVQHDDFSGGLRVSADKLYDLAAARSRFARHIRLTCNGQSSGHKLRELLGPYRPGNCRVAVAYHNQDAVCELMLGDEWRVDPRDELLESLAAWLEPDNVRVVYA
jgi:DNA polymerase-3 subunit alpha